LKKWLQRLGLIPKTSLPQTVLPKAVSPESLTTFIQSGDHPSRDDQHSQHQGQGRGARFAQKLANTLPPLQGPPFRGAMKRTLEAIRYIEDQLVQVRQKLREAEEEFNRFTQNNQILSIDIQSEKLLGQVRKCRMESGSSLRTKRSSEAWWLDWTNSLPTLSSQATSTPPRPTTVSVRQ